MALRMIDFECTKCNHIFEDLASTCVNGLAKPTSCPKCDSLAEMIMDFNTRVHRKGNRYRDVSWSSWQIT